MLDEKRNIAVDMLTALIVHTYTKDIEHGGNPDLEDITKFLEKDFNKFTLDKHRVENSKTALDWNKYGMAAYDQAICTLIENGTLKS